MKINQKLCFIILIIKPDKNMKTKINHQNRKYSHLIALILKHYFDLIYEIFNNVKYS